MVATQIRAKNEQEIRTEILGIVGRYANATELSDAQVKGALAWVRQALDGYVKSGVLTQGSANGIYKYAEDALRKAKTEIEQSKPARLPREPIELTPSAKQTAADDAFERAKQGLDAFIAGKSGSERRTLLEAKAELDEYVKVVLAEFNRMINYTSPDGLVSTWDYSLAELNDKVKDGLGLLSKREGVRSKAEGMLGDYFLAKLHSDMFKPSYVIGNPVITYVKSVGENGFVFERPFARQTDLLGAFKGVYEIDLLMKGLVYGTGMPEGLSVRRGESAADAVGAFVGGRLNKKGSEIALAYLYGANGEVLDRFAEMIGMGGSYNAGSIVEKYTSICMWTAKNKDMLQAEQGGVSGIPYLLSETRQVGTSDVVRSEFDFMAVAAVARQYQNEREDKIMGAPRQLAMLAELVNYAHESGMPPYSQTMMLCTDFAKLRNGVSDLQESERQGVYRQFVDSYRTIYQRAAASSRYGFLSDFVDGISRLDRIGMLDTLRSQLVETDADGHLRIREAERLLYRSPRQGMDFTTRQIGQSFPRWGPYTNSQDMVRAMDEFGVLWPTERGVIIGYEPDGLLQLRVSEFGWRMGIDGLANAAYVGIEKENRSILGMSHGFEAAVDLEGSTFGDETTKGTASVGLSDTRGARTRAAYETDVTTRRNEQLERTGEDRRERYEAEIARSALNGETLLLTEVLGSLGRTGSIAQETNSEGAFVENATEVTDKTLLAQLSAASASGSNFAVKVTADTHRDRTSTETEGTETGASRTGETINADLFYFAGNKWWRSNVRHRINRDGFERMLHLYNEAYLGSEEGAGGMLVGHEHERIAGQSARKADGFLAGFSIGELGILGDAGTLGAKTIGGNLGAIVGGERREGWVPKGATYLAYIDTTKEAGRAGVKGVVFEDVEKGKRKVTLMGGENFAGGQYITKPAGIALSYSFNPLAGTYVTEGDFGFRTGTIAGAAYSESEGGREWKDAQLMRGGMGLGLKLSDEYTLLIEGSYNRGALQGRLGDTTQLRKELLDFMSRVSTTASEEGFYSPNRSKERENLLKGWGAGLADIVQKYAKTSARDMLTGDVPLLSAVTIVKGEKGGKEDYSIGIKYTSYLPQALVGEMGGAPPIGSEQEIKSGRQIVLVANFNATNRLSIFGATPLTRVSESQVGAGPSNIVEFGGAKYRLGNNWTIAGIVSNYSRPKSTEKPVELDLQYETVVGGKRVVAGLGLMQFNPQTKKAEFRLFRGNESGIGLTVRGISGRELDMIGSDAEYRWNLYNAISAGVQRTWESQGIRIDTISGRAQLGNVPKFGIRPGKLQSNLNFEIARDEIFGLGAHGTNWRVKGGLSVSGF